MTHDNSSHYGDMLANIRDRILEDVHGLLEKLGGKISFEHYQDFELIDEKYTFFGTDNDGYGLALSLKTAETVNGKVFIELEDAEQTSLDTRTLDELDAVEALHLLKELEQIADYCESNGKAPVTEFDMDFDPDDE